MIRFAKKEELEAVSLLWERMSEDKRPDGIANKELWLKMIELIFDSEFYILLVAVVEDKIVGFIDGMVYIEPSTGKKHGVGQSFYIVPEFRNTTIVAQLYGSMLAYALDNAVEILEVTPHPSNIKFWGKRGFKTDRVIMRRGI